MAGSAGFLLRYNGRSWSRVRSKALTGLQFGDLVAVAPGNVWVVARPPSSRPIAGFLQHLKGTAWTRVRFPSWPVTEFALAPDGSGGLWIDNLAISASVGPTADHLSRAGRWRQYRIPRAGLMYDLARIPGTSSLWGTGYVRSDAAIWAYGPVG